jgi:2-oxoisovalerate dehydrogenase E2 component (dihydrolipoyl transacylase)
VVEVPAPFAGVIAALHGKPGDTVATGAPLVDFEGGTAVAASPATAKPAAATAATPGTGAPGTSQGGVVARCRKPTR